VSRYLHCHTEPSDRRHLAGRPPLPSVASTKPMVRCSLAEPPLLPNAAGPLLAPPSLPTYISSSGPEKDLSENHRSWHPSRSNEQTHTFEPTRGLCAVRRYERIHHAGSAKRRRPEQRLDQVRNGGIEIDCACLPNEHRPGFRDLDLVVNKAGRSRSTAVALTTPSIHLPHDE
jgi:hypothetical protein